MAYLDMLFDFAYFMAGYNKPLIVSQEGVLRNSAIPIYSNIPFSYLKENVSFVFNSIDFNSVLNCGESHMLSKLPNEIGMYIALTGNTMTEGDILKLGLVKEKRQFDQNDFLRLSEISKQAFDFIDYDSGYEPVYKHTLSRKADSNEMIKEFYERGVDENESDVLFDLFYRKKMIGNANLVSEMTGDGDLRFKIDSEEQRYFSMIENNLKSFKTLLLDERKEDDHLSDEKAIHYTNRYRIAELFSKDSVDEIIDALEQDQSEFALKTLSQLRSKSRFILDLNFKLMRKARNMSYTECLMLEYTTMKNMIHNEKLSPYIFKKGNANVTLSAAEIDQIVDDRNLTFSTKIGRSDMMPVSDYYQSYPEAFMAYMGGSYVSNPDQMVNFENVVKTNLFRLGIDYQSPGFNKNFVKDKLKYYEKWMRKLKFKTEKIEEMAFNPNLYWKYVKEREKEIQAFFQEDKFQNNLKAVIEKVYDSFIEENIVNMYEAKNSLEQLDKRRYAVEIKNIMAGGRFSRKNEEMNFDDFGDLFLEIGDRAGKLSKKFQRYVDEAKFRAKYKKIIKIRKSEINDFIKGKKESFKVELIENNKDEIKIDMKELNRSFIHTEERKENQYVNFANIISEQGMIPQEESYRVNFVNKVLNAGLVGFKQISNEKRAELFEELYVKFYGERLERKSIYELLDMTNKGEFQFKMNPLYDEIKIDLINDLPEKKEKRFEYHDINEAELHEAIDMNYLFKNNSKVDGLYNELKSGNYFKFLKSFDILTETQRKVFSLIEEHKETPFFTELYDYITETVKSAVERFDCEDKLEENQNSNSAFKTDIDTQLKLEFMNYILPHIIFNTSLKTLDSYERIVSNMKLDEGKLVGDDTEILKRNGIPVKAPEQATLMLKNLDFVFFNTLDLYEEYQNKLSEPEDLLKRDYARFLSYLKDIEEMRINQNANMPKINFREFVDVVNGRKQAEEDLIENIDPLLDFDSLTKKILHKNKIHLEPIYSQNYIEESLSGRKAEKMQELNKGFVEYFNKLNFFATKLDNIEHEKWKTMLKEELADFRNTLNQYNEIPNYMYSRVLEQVDMKFREIEKKFQSKQKELLKQNQNLVKERDELFAKIQKEKKEAYDPPKEPKKISKKRRIEIEIKSHLDLFKERVQKIKEDLKEMDFSTADSPLEKILDDLGYGINSYFDKQIGLDVKPEFVKELKVLIGDDMYQSNSIVEKLKNNYKTVRRNVVGSDLHPEEINYIAEIEHQADMNKKWSVNFSCLPFIKELQLELEIYTKGENSCMEGYYSHMNKENTDIPDSFTELDHRQKAREWFDLRIIYYIRRILNHRKEVEPQVDDTGLKVMDSILNRYLSKENLEELMKEALSSDINMFNFVSNSIIAAKDDLPSNLINAEKIDYRLINPDFTIKNEEAMKQAITMALSIKSQKHPQNMEHIRAYDFMGELSQLALKEREAYVPVKSDAQIEEEERQRNLEQMDKNKINIQLADILKVSKDYYEKATAAETD